MSQSKNGLFFCSNTQNDNHIEHISSIENSLITSRLGSECAFLFYSKGTAYSRDNKASMEEYFAPKMHGGVIWRTFQYCLICQLMLPSSKSLKHWYNLLTDTITF